MQPYDPEKTKDEEENNATDKKTESGSLSTRPKDRYELLDTLRKYVEENDVMDRTTGSVTDVKFDSSIFIKKVHNALSEDEIKEKAEDSVKGKYNEAMSKLDKNFQEDNFALQKSKSEATKKAEEDKAKLDDMYNSAKESASSEAIKRGLARSSIIAKQLEGLDKDKIADNEKLTLALNERLSEIDDAVRSLNSERNKAIQELNLEKATEIEEKILELKDKEQKAIDEVLEYNNKIEKEESDFKAEVEKYLANKADKDYERLHKYKQNGLTLSKGQKLNVIQQIKNYYKNYSSTRDAYNDFTLDNSFLEFLTDGEYRQLAAEILRGE